MLSWGDGAGILIQIPDAFYREEMAKQSISCPQRANTASAWSSCPRKPHRALPVEQELERAVRAENQVLVLVGVMYGSTAKCRCRRACAPKSP